MALITADEDVRNLLHSSKLIFMVGASANPMRDSNKVFQFFQHLGHRVIPVTPQQEPVGGEPTYPSLAAAFAKFGKPDLVNVFRRKSAAMEIAQQTASIGAQAIWFQLDTHQHQATEFCLEANMQVVENRCMLTEYQRVAMAEH